jgi:hypothetical protein
MLGIAMVEASGHQIDYERTDANPYLVATLAAGIALFLLASPYVLLALYPLARQEPISPRAALPPEPRLQIDPQSDLDAFRAAETARLSTYGWIDRQAGVVRLPIDRAMALTAARGLPGWTRR